MFDPSTKVLIVDDMSMMRKTVAKFCKAFGLTDITEATDGAEAWSAIVAASPAFGLIISDWNMPNCTGLDLLKRLRADSRYSKTPLVMLTAEKEKHQILEAINAGVSEYVVKPFTQQVLEQKLNGLHTKLTKR